MADKVDLKGMIERLKILSPEINKQTDEATRLIHAANDFLVNEIPILVRAEHTYKITRKGIRISKSNISYERKEYTEVECMLVFGRYGVGGNNWQIYCVERNVETGFYSLNVPLASAPRDKKLEAVHAISGLFGDVLVSLEKFLENHAKSIENVKQELREFGINV